ncbi:ATP synthase F0 subunit B [Candidatus Berkelbacteria bacterium CG10_big_fil_rev_8_21_14_0_10_43_13]|uniref:ATP synthase subunit b n=1 Tax=Candidatus Berkelbacteria bacterium CG10_big_fil_rev_8_21_14_0_10_43_13 TaxID=1974514 RepID=A0A2H0W683_9BACT|nr:F0F1 ATP synthase subunit B [bacterium]PIS07504.1 MAG: ATP synthase F0 subunit B [Candidatus Berkelbacteria bacterium CG10_big_fil_rev_8_21_14_0_10_43_13]
MEVLGIDVKLIIAQIVNFAILFFLLSKLLYKPITGLLEDRQTKIDKGLKDAEKAAKDRSGAEIEAEKIAEKAYKDANEILKNAKSEATAEAAAIIKKASEQADRIMANAKSEATLSKEKALKDAKTEISDVVVIALSKIVGDELTEEQKNKLTSKAIMEL